MAITVHLRWPLIDARVEAKGGTMAVTEAARLHRSTISRWRTRNALPNDPLQFLRFARALDIDPLLLFEIEEPTFAKVCVEIGWRLRTGSLGKALGSLRFIEQFWTWGDPNWPRPHVDGPSGRFLCGWKVGEFKHEGQFGEGRAGRNFYASVAMDGARIRARRDPQVWHIAYRDLTGGPANWNPYGAVALVDGRLELYAYQGRVQIVEATGPIAVETWFGEGDAEFRLASLHEFAFDLRRETQPGEAVVQFSLPRIGELFQGGVASMWGRKQRWGGESEN